MPEELIKALKHFATKDAAMDDPDFNAYDYSGGNYDDAFSAGEREGQIILARDILDKFFPDESY